MERDKLETRLRQYGEVKTDVDLSTLSTMNVGGKAWFVLYPHDVIALQQAVCWFKELQIPYKLWGNGSNILPSDKLYPGVILRLNHTLNSVFYDENSVVAEAGVALIALAYECSRKGLSCLEWAGGIPGTIGGALYMNAGSYKKAMSDCVAEVLVLDQDEMRWIGVNDCQFGYRESRFKHEPMIILAARLKTQQVDPEQLQAIMQERQARRMNSQPLNYPSAGSCFRNPEGQNAWELIDRSGLRGKRIGGAMVSLKHSNFIVNVDRAQASDVYELMENVASSVKESTGVDLCLEIEMFNWM